MASTTWCTAILSLTVCLMSTQDAQGVEEAQTFSRWGKLIFHSAKVSHEKLNFRKVILLVNKV